MWISWGLFFMFLEPHWQEFSSCHSSNNSCTFPWNIICADIVPNPLKCHCPANEVKFIQCSPDMPVSALSICTECLLQWTHRFLSPFLPLPLALSMPAVSPPFWITNQISYFHGATLHFFIFFSLYKQILQKKEILSLFLALLGLLILQHMHSWHWICRLKV